MTILQFKLAQLFIIQIPFLIIFRHGAQKALLQAKRQQWVDLESRKRKLKVSVAGTTRNDRCCKALLLGC
jgi:hypothetical protein